MRRIKLLQVCALVCFLQPSLHAQNAIKLPEHDAKPFYFGFTIGANAAAFKLSMHQQFLLNDSIAAASPVNSFGFTIGFLTTASLSNHFQLRINPQLDFTKKRIDYLLKYPEAKLLNVEKSASSVIVNLPLQLKMQSDRIGNFRFYALAGFWGSMDLNSHVRAKEDNATLPLQRYSYGPQLGLGFNFFFSTFILSPEISISNSLNNVQNRDANFKYSAVIDKMQTRMVTFCIHIEG